MKWLIIWVSLINFTSACITSGTPVADQSQPASAKQNSAQSSKATPEQNPSELIRKAPAPKVEFQRKRCLRQQREGEGRPDADPSIQVGIQENGPYYFTEYGCE